MIVSRATDNRSEARGRDGSGSGGGTRFDKILDGRLKKAEAEDKKFDARFQGAMESAKHHFMEEELQIFPKAKKTRKGDLERMGKEMQALEKQLME